MKNLFKKIPKVFGYIAIGSLLAMNLIMAFVLIAPPELYDPIYTRLYGDVASAQAQTETEAASEHTGAGTPTEEPPSAPLEIRPGQGLMIDTGSKIVNLVDPTGRKYLRVGIYLEFAPTDLRFYTMPEEEKALFITTFEEDINNKMPIINDVIITLISSKTFDSVYTADGKEILRKELLDTVNTQLHEYRVIFVYFTEFVVQ